MVQSQWRRTQHRQQAVTVVVVAVVVVMSKVPPRLLKSPHDDADVFGDADDDVVASLGDCVDLHSYFDFGDADASADLMMDTCRDPDPHCQFPITKRQKKRNHSENRFGSAYHRLIHIEGDIAAGTRLGTFP